MLTTAHAVTGATIGVLIPNPWIAVPLALGSHFILDSIPHWQETLAPYVPTKKTYIRIPLDVALSVALVVLITVWHPAATTHIWMSTIAANVADADTLTILLPSIRRGLIAQFYDWHCNIQRETSSIWGIFTQTGLVVLCLVATYPH